MVNGEDAWLNMVELSHPCHPCHGCLKHPFQGCTNQIYKSIMADFNYGALHGQLVSALNSGVCTMEGTEDLMSYNVQQRKVYL